MQEQQSTSTDNTYYNLVSVLYHALETAQTSASYIQDAQQSNNQQLAQFFQQVQQQANQTANQAKQMLANMKPRFSIVIRATFVLLLFKKLLKTASRLFIPPKGSCFELVLYHS